MAMYGYENAWIMTAQLNEKKDGCGLCMRPLVLCKDCKHGEPCNEDVYCTKDIGTIESSVHEPYWFCADGERE